MLGSLRKSPATHFCAAPALVEAASRDLKSIAEHDPATTALLPPLLNFKGYVALQAFRVSNWLWSNDRDRSRAAAAERILRPAPGQYPSIRQDRTRRFSSTTRPESSSAPLSEIGDEVTIMQNVTIGRRDGGPRAADRPRRAAVVRRDDPGRRQHRRFRQDRRVAPSSRRMCRPAAPSSACRRA